MILDDEIASEYEAELRQLKAEDDAIEAEIKPLTARRSDIKARIKEIAKVAGSETERVVLPAGDHGAWDRVVNNKGGGVSFALLEEVLGEDKYRKLCCIRTYVPSEDKIRMNRVSGKITDDDIARATVEPERTYTLRKMNPKQYKRHLATRETDE